MSDDKREPTPIPDSIKDLYRDEVLDLIKDFYRAEFYCLGCRSGLNEYHYRGTYDDRTIVGCGFCSTIMLMDEEQLRQHVVSREFAQVLIHYSDRLRKLLQDLWSEDRSEHEDFFDEDIGEFSIEKELNKKYPRSIKMKPVRDKVLVVLEWLAGQQWLSTQELDAKLEELTGNAFEAKMCCNVLLRDGWLEYFGDGSWRSNVTPENLQELRESESEELTDE